MSKGSNPRPVNKKAYDRTMDAVFGVRYICECGERFRERSADWKTIGTGDHVTEIAICPECKSEEITEL